MTDAAGFKQGRPVTQVPIMPQGETEPKKNGRPPGAKTSPQAPSRRSLETQIGGTLVVINMVVMSIPPIAPDALDVVEINALAKAIDLQCRQSVRFRKYVEAALGAGSGAGLIGVCLMIGARRAARHNMIPTELDGAIGGMIAQAANAKPVPVEV